MLSSTLGVIIADKSGKNRRRSSTNLRRGRESERPGKKVREKERLEEMKSKNHRYNFFLLLRERYYWRGQR